MLTFVKTTTTTVVYLLLRSILLVPLGVLLVGLSVLLLWMNENITPRADLAAGAHVLSADTPVRSQRGVSTVTGELGASAPVQDAEFVRGVDGVLLYRSVEYYRWVELESRETERRWGGGRRTTHEYDYKRAWLPHVPNSEYFAFPDGHTNPPPVVADAVFVAEDVRVGAWAFDIYALFSVPHRQRLLLDSVELIGRAENATRVGNSLYMGDADPTSPTVGDERVTFFYVPTGSLVTIFGKAENGGFVPYSSKRHGVFYDMHGGELETAIDILAYEDSMRLYLLRILGFFGLWFGFYLLGSVFIAVADIIPPVGGVLRIIVGVLALFPTISLGTIVVALGMAASNPWITGTVLTLLVALIIVLSVTYDDTPPGQRAPKEGGAPDSVSTPS